MKKNKGALLIEFLLSSLLSSIILVVAYQLYQTAFKNIDYMRTDSTFQIEKLITLYNLEADALQIVLPNDIEELCQKIIAYKKKNPSENTAIENQKKPASPGVTEKNKGGDEKQEKEKKAIERNIEKLGLFIPTLKKNQEEIIISWITQRKLLHKELFSKVFYIFKKIKGQNKKNCYALYRKEVPINAAYELIKNDREKEYKFISYIEDLEVAFLSALTEQEKNETAHKEELTDTKVKKNDKQKSPFFEWEKKKTFITQSASEEITLENILSTPFVPYLLIISGDITTAEGGKKMDINLKISFPISDYLLNVFLANPTEQKGEQTILSSEKKSAPSFQQSTQIPAVKPSFGGMT